MTDRVATPATVAAIIRRRAFALAVAAEDMRDRAAHVLRDGCELPISSVHVDEVEDLLDGLSEQVTAMQERCAELRTALDREADDAQKGGC